jgi:hypothetical protein
MFLRFCMLEKTYSLNLNSMVAFLVSLGLVMRHRGVENVPPMPLGIKLLLYQFHNLLLFGLDASLLLPEPV